MRTRALIHVAGPPGSGKTTFIEAVLGAADGMILAARCVRDDSLRRSRETAPKTHPELRRYRRAGLFNDVLGLHGSRTPITAVIANLADPGDPGRKKALARVRRAIARCSP